MTSDRVKKYLALEAEAHSLGSKARRLGEGIRELGRAEVLAEMEPARYFVLWDGVGGAFYKNGNLVSSGEREALLLTVLGQLTKDFNIQFTHDDVCGTPIEELARQNNFLYPGTLRELMDNWGYTGIGRNKVVAKNEE